MKKRRMIISPILAIALILAGAVCFFGERTETRIESDLEENIIRVLGKNSPEGSLGTGIITVGEGEHLHLDYAVKKGSLDIYVSGPSGADEQARMDERTENLTGTEAAMALFGSVSFSQEEITGEGTLDIEEEAGDYTVLFEMRDMTGEAVLSCVAGEG